MQGANTDACIHETCNVRTQMHAYMKHAMCEHICMQTGTVQGANTDACIHETCNVRTQMHAEGEGEGNSEKMTGTV